MGMILKKEINKINKIDRILSIKDNIITANGLDNAFLGEVVQFKNLLKCEHLGQIYNLENNLEDIVIFKVNNYPLCQEYNFKIYFRYEYQ